MKGDESHSTLGTVVIATDVIDSGLVASRTRNIILLLAASVALMMTGFGIIMPVFARRLGEFGSGVEALGLGLARRSSERIDRVRQLPAAAGGLDREI